MTDNEPKDGKCPLCGAKVEFHWRSYHRIYGHKCESCGQQLMLCYRCSKYSKISWQPVFGTPSMGLQCQHCGEINRDHLYVKKSEIYKHYAFAFKLVHRHSIPYPLYNRYGFPFGRPKEDLGDYVNDFCYADQESEGWRSTDGGTARGYRVLFDVDGEEVDSIVLSHESGIELFLIAAGAFVGIEVAKYSIKRILEAAEKSVNKWYANVKKKEQLISRRDREDSDSIVDHIAIRTPFWEISLDGRFSPQEREELLEYLEQNLLPKEEIQDYVSALQDDELREKLVTATRTIARRERQG